MICTKQSALRSKCALQAKRGKTNNRSHKLCRVLIPCEFSEVMGAVMSVLFIWVLTGVLVYLAVQRIMTKQYDIDAQVMLLTASAGLIINIM